MNYAELPLFQVMKVKMGYLSARAAVIAQNVANADTPDYKSRDVAAPNFKSILGGEMQQNSTFASAGRMAVTNKMHLSGSENRAANFMAMPSKTTYELNPNGNNVVIEEEMAKVSETQAEYQKTLNLYKKTVDMFKTALGRNSGGA